MKSIFDQFRRGDFIELLQRCQKYISIDVEKAAHAAYELIHEHQKRIPCLQSNPIKQLED